jgi:hypothetical protein
VGDTDSLGEAERGGVEGVGSPAWGSGVPPDCLRLLVVGRLALDLPHFYCRTSRPTHTGHPTPSPNSREPRLSHTLSPARERFRDRGPAAEPRADLVKIVMIQSANARSFGAKHVKPKRLFQLPQIGMLEKRAFNRMSHP